MAVYHTQIRPRFHVRVTTPNDDLPDAGSVVVYMDGPDRNVVPNGAAWSGNPVLPDGVVDGELKTTAAWDAEKTARVDSMKQILRGMLSDLDAAQKGELEQAFADMDARALLLEYVVGVVRDLVRQ
jgi:hypothetical protein